MIAMNGASVCTCERIMWACHPEHNEGRFHPTLPLKDQKRPRRTAAAVQHQRSSQGSYTQERLCFPFSTWHSGLLRQPHSDGEPCINSRTWKNGTKKHWAWLMAPSISFSLSREVQVVLYAVYVVSCSDTRIYQ